MARGAPHRFPSPSPQAGLIVIVIVGWAGPVLTRSRAEFRRDQMNGRGRCLLTDSDLGWADRYRYRGVSLAVRAEPGRAGLIVVVIVPVVWAGLSRAEVHCTGGGAAHRSGLGWVATGSGLIVVVIAGWAGLPAGLRFTNGRGCSSPICWADRYRYRYRGLGRAGSQVELHQRPGALPPHRSLHTSQ
jgi:hypothetical protein